MSCGCKYYVNPLHDTMGWSAVCYCCISWPYSIIFSGSILIVKIMILIYILGKISCKELKYVLTSIGEKLTDAEFSDLIREADMDGDGSISFEGLSFFFYFMLDFSMNMIKMHNLFT